MTGGTRERLDLSRRRLLSAAGAGVAAALTGCGYRPGGGDLVWESELDDGGILGSGRTWFAVTTDRLFAVRNQSGRTYDFEAETWGTVENASVTAVDRAGTPRLHAETERQAVAPPAVTDSSVFVPVEGGGVTAIDRDAAGVDPDARRTTGGTGGDETGTGAAEDDEIRWQVDGIAANGGGSDASDGLDESDGSDESDGTTDPPGIDGLRASERLVAVIAETDLVALDAETGDRAFRVAEAWPGGTGGGAGRVAVDGDDVWAAVAATGDESGSEESGSEESSGGRGTVLARFGPTGDRRAARSLSAEADWLAVAGETITVGEAGDRLVSYDRDLDRRFALPERSPRDRPRAPPGDGSRLYYATGGTVRSVDASGGELAWERSDLPGGPLAVDREGAYVAENGSGFGGGSESRIVAVDADGGDRWTAPLPEGVAVDELFAVAGRLIVVDGEELYGFHAAPGERWSVLG
ncbi:hypothetical protein CK500_07975 [Halorubrum salipaludis]|uniref:Pyrrolo-quinoline quinone n=1 Tax=Halorubrum salipaludis TaxID=2032630 RepID=A0A2A2FI48_9EURY|nr:PQQ-binding-like beta-propeller repeat protein [Halorubrum salipaludis]PAU84357.1 hypothetical protein CK500_07975 [Halorubrum salipaludis]